MQFPGRALLLRKTARLFPLLVLLLAGTAAAAEAVRLQLKWQHQFQFAGYYAALEKGFYRQAGLDVEIIPGRPGEDSVRNVLAGKAEFGVGTTDLLLLREKGEPVVALAVIFQHSPLALVTLKTAGNQSLHDIAGHPLMIEPGSAELLAYLRREGLGSERFELLPHSSRVADLAAGKVAGMSVYTTDEPFELVRAGREYVLHSPRTGGIDFYGDNLFTTEAQLQAHPERVEKFRAASLQGWDYAMRHPEEIAALIHSRYSPRHSLEHLLFEARQMAPLLQTALVQPGHMYAGRWRHIASVYAELGMLKPDFDFDGFLYDPHPPPPDLTWVYAGFAVLLAVLAGVGGAAYYIARANRRLRSSDKRYRALFETLPLALVVSSREDRIIDWNAAATRLFGWGRDEALGRDLYGLLVPDAERSEVRRKVRSTLDQLAATRSINCNRTRDGRVLTCEWHNTLYYDQDGKVAGVISLGADISERQNAQAQLQQAKDMAEQLLADQRQFIAMVSHEFRSPLAAIDSASQLLQMLQAHCDRHECGASHVSLRIRRGVQRLSGFIDNCLTEDRLSRLGHEGLRLAAESVGLPAFLADMVHQARQGEPQHRIVLEREAMPERLHADPQLLAVLLQNLLGNACKYSESGSTVCLRARGEGDGGLALAVIDQGSGIPEHELGKVCQRYFRGENRAQTSGTGLGLFLAERIARLHGGSLHIESQAGRGTTVTVRLPPAGAGGG